MKAQSNDMPSHIEDVGGGVYYVNMNITEHPSGERVTYEYEYVKTSGYPTYGVVVEKLIRERYTESDELALHRQRDTKPEAFQEYNDFCEACKDKARPVFYPNENQ